MYIPTNPNPNNRNTGDCVVRAISIAEDKDWDDVYLDLFAEGFFEKEMAETNWLWGGYLRKLGYVRHGIPDTCPDCYTIREFAEDHPHGIYIVGTGSHVVAVINGDYYDTWDSGHKVPLFYFAKER